MHWYRCMSVYWLCNVLLDDCSRGSTLVVTLATLAYELLQYVEFLFWWLGQVYFKWTDYSAHWVSIYLIRKQLLEMQCCLHFKGQQKPATFWEQEIRMADYIFYRTFDVRHCTISDKMDDKVGGLEGKERRSCSM